MDFENIEYWVLKSMEEAKVSLQYGEVPVGSLFLIQKEILDSFGETLNSRKLKTVEEKSVEDFSEKGGGTEEVLSTKEMFSNVESKDQSGGYVVLARGKNEVNATKNATRHAEMVCIDQIVELCSTNYSRVFEKITVIVNVEPCIMCMAALLDLNVKTIVFTCVNDRFGYNILRQEDRTNYFEVIEIRDKRFGSEEAVGKSQSSVSCERLEKSESSNLSDTEYSSATTKEILLEKENKTSENFDGTNTQYSLSYKDKKIIANKNDKISSKISSLLHDGLNLCNVFHYRKYEAETLSILKLFYKGTNPNAPKNKVKIKN